MQPVLEIMPGGEMTDCDSWIDELIAGLGRKEVDALIGDIDAAICPYGDCNPDSSWCDPLLEQKNSRKKTWNIISNILFFAVLAAIAVGAFFISQGDKIPVMGYSLLNVLTWSMEPEIPQGSLVIIRKTDPNEIKISDDITFMVDEHTSVTHRVIGIIEEYNGTGARGFETQGINNDTPDFDIVIAENVAGVVRACVPRLGSWLAWLRENIILTIGGMGGIVLLTIFLKGAFKKSPDEKEGKKVIV